MIKGKENFLHIPSGVVGRHMGAMPGFLYAWGVCRPQVLTPQISVYQSYVYSPPYVCTPPCMSPCNPGNIWGVHLYVCVSCITRHLSLFFYVLCIFYASLLMLYIQNPYNVIIFFCILLFCIFLSVFMKPKVFQPTNRA